MHLDHDVSVMADPRLFVSHAASDREVVENLLRPIRNLPVDVALAEEELEPGTARRDLEGQVKNSDVLLPILTDAGAADPLVNQEIGYAVAQDKPILPVVTDESNLTGHVSGVDATTYDRSNLEETAFHLLTALRTELQPLGNLSTPNWFLTFGCSRGDCDTQVQLPIDEPQAVLWKLYQHDERLEAVCPNCGREYEFNPATLGYVEPTAPRQ